MKAMLFLVPFDEKPKPHLTLAQYLWERDDERDFIISVGKKSEPKNDIKINKCVFASRSPVFGRMLETAVKEKPEKKLEIIDFDAEIVKISVAYFYDRETYKTRNVDQLIDLLQLAENYDIQDLKVL
uniref:BTB domain-containing protein n=1 Tax=Panagrolaimus davidi TaxID=227884 RepID=A0A914PJV5_9BILA